VNSSSNNLHSSKDKKRHTTVLQDASKIYLHFKNLAWPTFFDFEFFTGGLMLNFLLCFVREEEEEEGEGEEENGLGRL